MAMRSGLRPVAGCVLVVLWWAAIWFDHSVPTAGIWALLGLSLSTGLVHGALDAQLLLQRFASQSRALAMASLYLLGVLVVGAMLSLQPGVALFALVAMSAWHFGEGYGRWTASRPALDGLTRVVVGGAPVLLFPWMASDAAAVHLLPWLGGNALQAWRGLGLLWLALFAGWAGGCGIPGWRSYRYAWVELAGIALLNLSLSPLMAFALYFGAYHAPVHIWRVLRSGRRDATRRTGTVRWGAFAAAVVLTVVLGTLLWRLPNGLAVSPTEASEWVRWLVVALAALTFPHLVLISACARILSVSQRRL
ncbi:MAG: Brp/Blh family beta-carotene 15,15'-dioxygenase [Ferruginibacter sp.]|nr:Brp/Blh family beta-carotene 15,15'-dioxygenase [Rhodoferax sp.]